VTVTDLSSTGLKAMFGGCFVLTVATCLYYPGQLFVYVAFSILANALLYLGLRRDSIFFDFFVGGLFWLGYWLKFSVRMILLDGKFHEPVGHFDYSPAAYDHALAVVSCGIGALVLARLLRARLIFRYPPEAASNGLVGLRETYRHHRKRFWTAFFLLVVVLAVSNFYFGIYQRGLAPRTTLPFQLGGVYTWLLLFGAASVSALMLEFEIQLHRSIPYALFLLVLLETFASNSSMLSRGMILNTGALLVGVYAAFRMRSIDFKRRPTVLAIAAILALFATSVGLVNSLRQVKMYAERASEVGVSEARVDAGRLSHDNKQVLLDRWVGIDGAAAVSSYPHLGWELFKEAWGERYLSRGTTMYDLKIAKSVSKERYEWLIENDKHFITLPGIIAFFFYPGSFAFLFVSMLIVGAIGAGIEIATYRLSGSVILCSLIAFVVAYRFAHFGYVPARSYLLFGAVALNLALIYLANRFFAAKYAD
jgi:hypothetical protein